MFENIEGLAGRYQEIMDELASGQTDAGRYTDLMKEQAELGPVVSKYKEYKDNETQIANCLEMIEEESDPEMKELAREELAEAKRMQPVLEDEIRRLLLPKDPNDEKNIIIEIRGGAGGDEAALAVLRGLFQDVGEIDHLDAGADFAAGARDLQHGDEDIAFRADLGIDELIGSEEPGPVDQVGGFGGGGGDQAPLRIFFHKKALLA